METIAVAIIGLNATLIGAMIWVLKFVAVKVFGSNGKEGAFAAFSATLKQMNDDIRESTVAIHEMRKTMEIISERDVNVPRRAKKAE